VSLFQNILLIKATILKLHWAFILTAILPVGDKGITKAVLAE
jgi:hypothetical protein